MAVFVSGNSGRIRVGGGNTVVAGFKSWKLTKTTVIVVAPHFESDTDADSNVWPENLAGLSAATMTAEGWMDTASGTAQDSGTAGLRNGLLVTVDLILVKATPFGFSNLSVRISQYEVGTAIDASNPATFSMQGTVSGVCTSSTSSVT